MRANKFTPPERAVRLKIRGRIGGKMHQASCWALPEKRTDFGWNCKHETVYGVITDSLPPVIKKAVIARVRRGGGLYVCRCTAEVIR
jgi:hypothetical protein